MQQRIELKLAALATTLVLAAAPALAQNNKGGGGSTSSAAGVITIDQARAEAGGVTPGDAPGFPVTISQPGSYRLMGNLVVTAANTTAIEVTADDVTLDLNGFTIRGPVACTGGSPAALTCTPASNGSAVYAYARHQVVVRNGTLRGFGYGVYNGWDGRMEALHVTQMSNYGLLGDAGTQIIGNVVSRAGGNGISGYGDIRDNSVRWVKANGIHAGSGSVVIGNRVNGAGLYGIDAYGYGNATLIHNSVNGGTLGQISQGVRVDGNACSGQLCQ